jgi:hypothetical protein
MERADTNAAALARSERLALLALLCFAAALRWLLWSRAVTLFNDGPEFLELAKSAGAGQWDVVLAHPYHPLYSLLVACVHAVGFDWESAGALVGVAGGTAAVAFLFLFLRDAFGAPAAWIGAGLLAVHSRAVEFSSDIQSDGLYLGLFLAGVWLGWRAWTRRSPGNAAAAGIASGLAYLTRPEGLGLACVVTVLVGLEWLRGSWRLAPALRVAGAVATAAALCVAPYVVALQQNGGGWTLTHKKSVSQLSGAAPPAANVASPTTAPSAPARALLRAPVPSGVSASRAQLDRGEDGLSVDQAASKPARAIASAKMLLRTSKSAFRYGVLLLFAAGLIAARGWPSQRGIFVGAIVVAYAGLLYALTFFMGYVSRRHALPPLVPLFGYAGLGALALASGFASLCSRRGIAWPGRASPVWIAASIAALVGVGELATQREPRREEDRAARAAAEWLRDNRPPAPLAANRLRLGYYAGMPYVPLVRVDSVAGESHLDEYLDEVGVRYLLLDDPKELEAVRRVEGTHLRPLHSVRQGEREAWVFERVERAEPPAESRP